MNRAILAMGFALATTSLVGAAGLKFSTNYESSLKQAKTSGQPVVLYFTMKG